MSEFKLGPLQKAWIKSLKEHPERQTTNILGKGIKDDPNNYKACCLGEGLMVLWRDGQIDCPIFEKAIISIGDTITPDYSESSTEEMYEFQLLGLKGTMGRLEKEVELHDFNPRLSNKKLGSLAEMNDGGLSWIEIAEYIENNPENVFNESV